MRPMIRSVVCFLLIFTVAGVAVAGAAGDIRKASSLVQRGDKAFKSGDAAKARELFEKALGIIPGLPEAHFGLGHLAMSQGRFEDALAEYSAAKQGYADVSGLVFKYESERYAAAQREIRDLEDQIRTINDITVKVSEATRQTKTVQLEERIRMLRSMEYPDSEAALEPPAEWYFHVGNALFRLKRNDEALANWTTCIEKDADFGLVYNNMAVLYMMTGRLDEAQASLAKAIELGVRVNPGLKADIERRLAAAGTSPGS